MIRPLTVAAAVCACTTSAVSASDNSSADYDSVRTLALIQAPQLHLEEVYVEGQRQQAASDISPTASITAEELEAINITTVEDAVSYEPNLVVRRRFIGDANGSLGIRGSNMFQTARTLVYADGLPLHYHLQTRWSGAPRWSLVSPDEIAAVDVLYGPFSAAYSGNAMGGAVRIITAMPSERVLKLRGTLFDQHYQQLATDEHYRGGRFNLSYGEALGDWRLFAFYNRLENDGQPMSQFAAPRQDAGPGATPVTGAVPGEDSRGRPVIYYGDSGPEAVSSELIKFKSQYEGELFQVRGTLAYEDRNGHTEASNNFLTNEAGEATWSGAARWQDVGFTINGGNFGAQQQRRRSLLAGVGASAPLGDWMLDLNLSRFDILEDAATSLLHHPDHPAFSPEGRLTEYDDTGWTTADASASSESLADGDIHLLLGVQYDAYRLNLTSFNLEDAYQDLGRQQRSTSGGQTRTGAVYAEATWHLHPRWAFTAGARYESWRASDGYTDDVTLDSRHEGGLSPKLSLEYAPQQEWLLRYSLARALRFPIVEELYQNESRTRSLQTADANLEPEDGLHHNWMIERQLIEGVVRINLFQERVENTIFNQLGVVNGLEISAFLGIDEVTTRGAEFIFNRRHLWQTPLDLRFNLSYLDARITRNTVNPAIEGNRFPRLPRWQSNLLLSYQWSDKITTSGGARYASNSYGELDNSDTASRAFGAHDAYLIFNLRGQWQVNNHLDLALGVDNLTNQVAYVHHPWPSRTVYLEAGYVF